MRTFTLRLAFAALLLALTSITARARLSPNRARSGALPSAAQSRGVTSASRSHFTEFHTEGPSVLRRGDEWIVYFDKYTRYGTVRTRDFKSWTDVSAELSFPRDHRHGTVLPLSPAIQA